MGYDVHITRKDNWFDETGDAISKDEWFGLIAADPEMRLDGYATATTPAGDTLTVDDPTIAVWTAFSGHGVGGNMAWMSLSGGTINATNPSPEILVKMHAIAMRLGARLQGDEDEFYGPSGAMIPTERPKPWWAFWR